MWAMKLQLTAKHLCIYHFKLKLCFTKPLHLSVRGWGMCLGKLCDVLIKNQLDMSLVLLSLLPVLPEVPNNKGFTVIIVLFVRGAIWNYSCVS